MLTFYDVTIESHIIQAAVINLKNEPLKYQNITGKLTQFNIPFKRFNAISGKDIYDEFQALGKFRNNGYNLRSHQVGVWQSHFSLWKTMVDQNIDRLFIFEDDCLFVKDFKTMYGKTLDLLSDKDYEIVFLGYSGASIDTQNDLHLISEGVPRCLHSYILTQSGAQKLVEKLNIIDFPIDEIIGRMFHKKEIKGYRTSYMLSYQPWQKREDKYPLPNKYTNRFDDLI